MPDNVQIGRLATLHVEPIGAIRGAKMPACPFVSVGSSNMGVAQNQTIGGANRRFWSMFPLPRASHFGFLSRSHIWKLIFASALQLTRFRPGRDPHEPVPVGGNRGRALVSAGAQLSASARSTGEAVQSVVFQFETFPCLPGDVRQVMASLQCRQDGVAGIVAAPDVPPFWKQAYPFHLGRWFIQATTIWCFLLWPLVVLSLRQ